MPRLRLLLVAFALLSQLLPLPALAHLPDFPVVNGHFYSEANGSPVYNEDLGFTITNDDDIPFWDAYKAAGGPSVLGFPISHRFQYNGFTVQATQYAVLQWDPATGEVSLMNVLDELSASGLDDWLEAARQIPPVPPSAASGASEAERLALLDQNPAIKALYLDAPDWLRRYGLPVVYAERDEAFVLRTQRAAFQQWKIDTPWASQGEVTLVAAGDLFKEVGFIPPRAAIPRPPPPPLAAADPQVPIRIIIPDIGVDAPVVALELNQDLTLPVPRTSYEVAWYTYSARAGQADNLVMSGHLNWDGQPGVFARLRELRGYQQVILVGADGRRFVYEVAECDNPYCALHPADDPADDVLGPSRFSHLTLITCEGRFDRITRNYSHRRIVRARLVAIEPVTTALEPGGRS